MLRMKTLALNFVFIMRSYQRCENSCQSQTTHCDLGDWGASRSARLLKSVRLHYLNCLRELCVTAAAACATSDHADKESDHRK